MDFFSTNTIAIPTKRESPSSNAVGVGGMVSSHRDSIRSNSSSSMQELRSNGRNLMSLSELSALEQSVELGNVSGMGGSAISTALDTHLGRLGALAEAGAGLHPSLNGLLGTSGGGGGVDHHYSLAATAATVHRERLNTLAAREAAPSRFKLPTTGCSRGHDSNNSLTMEEMLSMEGIMDNNASMAARDREATIRSTAYSTVAPSRAEQLRSIRAHAQAQAIYQLEMEEIMLQRQKHAATTGSTHVIRDHNQQRLALSEHSSSSQRRSSGSLARNLPDGFAHKHSSSSKRCDSGGVGAFGGLSRTRSLLDGITSAELLREVEQRQSQSQRGNSHDTLTGMEFGVGTPTIDPHHLSSAGLVGSPGGGVTSRDHLVDIYHQMQHPGSSATTQPSSGQQIHASGFDSFPSLARMSREDISDVFAYRRGRQHRCEGVVPSTTSVLIRSEIDKDASVADVKVMDRPRQIREQRRTNNASVVARVNTAKNTSLAKPTLCIKKPRSDKQLIAAAAAALIIEGERESSKLSGRKHKRNNSNSTSSFFDALISVFGDELAGQERKQDRGSKMAKVNTEDARGGDKRSGASVDFSNKPIEETVMAVARQRQEEAGVGVKDEDVGVEDKRRVSSNSSTSEYPILSQTAEEKDTSIVSLISAQDQQIYTPPRSSLQSESSDNDKVLSHMDLLLLDSVQKRNAAISSGSRKSNNGNDTTEGDVVTGNYGRKFMSFNTPSLMASLEAVQHDRRTSREQVALRDIAIRELQTQRAASMLGPSTVMAAPPPGGDPEIKRHAALFSGRTHVGPALRNSRASAADAMMARLQGFLQEGLPMSGLMPIVHHPSQMDHRGVGVLAAPHAPGMANETHPPSSVPEPHYVDHNVDLQRFLDGYGEAAEKSLKNTLEAISKTEESLANIHEWDRSHGLRKCHSRTVIKTRRSRARLKAFLNGLDPPKDLATNRKEKNKNEKAKWDKSLPLQPDYLEILLQMAFQREVASRGT
mmetsp:Transcript_10442/g.19191  ORF Transcript_10442/g.19191 Transcript_10442/m.19191 type:complete len:989 (+) Transcript_10442:430-3396(+)|eukprot:CAMPEP_0201681648 /NCGR_PEP_ID=MMETSP0494-20130426/51219_1 /ASSEMBLY_ACC=CAM_ASM_000839 /TAXON_ID=420259 /ORGANISM="Thalassiosira gravida, Strain GMp14c1" /LENGTH=988 /DNA_ID=CAMNT_0048165399 /DNA_START=851 /DNA_END=3817 /DNA_ORIENTATION=-